MTSGRHLVGTILTTTSIAVCLLAALGWVESHQGRDPLRQTAQIEQREGRYIWQGWLWKSHCGVVGMGREFFLEKTDGATDTYSAFIESLARRIVEGPRFNVIVERGDDDMARWSVWWIACPHWFVVTLTAIYPLWWGKEWWRKRRSRQWREHGMCGVCGYDLRASTEKCPECGTARGVHFGGNVSRSSKQSPHPDPLP